MPGSNTNSRRDEVCRDMPFYAVRETGPIICYFLFEAVNACYIVFHLPI